MPPIAIAGMVRESLLTISPRLASHSQACHSCRRLRSHIRMDSSIPLKAFVAHKNVSHFCKSCGLLFVIFSSITLITLPNYSLAKPLGHRNGHGITKLTITSAVALTGGEVIGEALKTLRL